MEEELDLLCIVLEGRMKLKGTKPGLIGGDGEYKPAFHLQCQGFNQLCGKELCGCFFSSNLFNIHFGGTYTLVSLVYTRKIN